MGVTTLLIFEQCDRSHSSISLSIPLFEELLARYDHLPWR